MAKNSKRKLLFTASFLTILLFSSVYAALLPNAHAAEMTNQEKGLSILSNVVGVDLTKYEVTAKETPVDSQASYLGVIPRKNVAYDLASDDGKLKAIYTFADGNLQMIHVLETEGSPSLAKSAAFANDVELAKDFLSNYQTYTANSLFGELRSTLKYGFAGNNLTKTSGNTVLEAVANDGCTTFKWYYSENGAVAPYSKFVSLSFKDGFLWFFVDNWQFYSVGSTAVNLSEKEAVAIALDAAKAHSWSLKLEADALDAENFNESNVRWASLIFDNSLDASKMRSEDLLELYPVWRVGIALNKWYGQMYGIQVDIWADTKEVRSVQEAWSTLPPPEDAPIAYVDQAAGSEAKPSLGMVIAVPALVAVAMAAVLWMGRKKKGHYYSLLRPRGVKAGGILLCVLVASMMLSASVATVKATTRAAVIWGSESIGGYEEDVSGDWDYWRKSEAEVEYQNYTAYWIAKYFDDNGYTGIDHQGDPGSYRTQILTDMLSLSNYDYSAIVDFDHGVGGFPGQIPGYPIPGVPENEFHYMFEDHNGTLIGTRSSYSIDLSNAVYDMDLYFTLPAGGVKFAFMSFCKSASIADYVGNNYAAQRMIPASPPWWISRPVGMPLSCTGRFVADIDTTPGFNITYYISDDGYGDPDMGSQVYIGFPHGSASLSQPVPYQYGADPYYYWVIYFFYWALHDDISVNQALDDASYQVYGYYFGNCPLRTGFTACWWTPGDPMEEEDCTMAVYGNGNIRLKNYVPPSHSVAVRSLSGPTSGDISTSYQFSASAADSQDHMVRYVFDWGDGSPQTWTDWNYSYATVVASHSWESQGIYSVKVRAQCTSGVNSSWSSPRSINIGNVPVYYWLSVGAGHCMGYPVYPNIYIDGNWVGTGCVEVQVVEGWHTILVDDPVWCDGYFAYLWYFTDGYGNGEARPIYSSTWVGACYC